MLLIGRSLACLLPILAAHGATMPLGAQASRSALAAYDFKGRPAQFDLPGPLREISGLAIDTRGRLFAHQDERAAVFQINPLDGRVVKRFTLGAPPARGDFEGIAIAGTRMFMVSSEGTLFEFADAAADSAAAFRRHSLGTARRCAEIEGLEYDPGTNQLLLACKTTAGAAQRDHLLVLAYSLRTGTVEAEPRFSIPLTTIRGAGGRKNLSPSGIALNPVSRTIFVLAARENLLVELSAAGGVLGRVELDRKTHHQAEGIVFAADGTMYIADEGRSGRATLTAYRPDPARLRAARE
jgi:uncharacterized protein YjiK